MIGACVAATACGRREDTAPPVDDPFAPPPERKVELEVRADDILDAKRMHAERDTRAKAQLRAEAEALEHERDMRLTAREETPWLIAMDHRTRAYCITGAIAAGALIAEIAGPIGWGVAIAAVVVLGLTALARS